MPNEVKMKPCPWCGGAIGPLVIHGSTSRWRKVAGCCADGPEVRHSTMANDQVTATKDSTKRAIEAWNDRPKNQENNMPQIIRFTKLSHLAKTPVRSSEHAAGFDLYSTDVIFQGGRFVVSTGLATAFDEGHVLLVYGRSGLASKYGVKLTNGVGVIDADYRGEIKLIFDVPEMGLAQSLLGEGNRVAQAILMPIPKVVWEEVAVLPDTVRGSGGFGSTGNT